MDVGYRRSILAILEGNDVVYMGEPTNVRCVLCGLDAPLALTKEAFRDCDREVLKLGIPLYPVNIEFMRRIHERAMELVRMLRCSYVLEVYPHATRKLLGFVYNKRKLHGRRRIEEHLGRYLNPGPYSNLDADELDALTAALTVRLFLDGRAGFVGRECRILVPCSGRMLDFCS